MSIIDSEELETICVNIIIEKINGLEELFDNKKEEDKDIMPMMVKYVVALKEKTNKIPTGPELIKLLDLTNTISTFDALNTQIKTISAIVGKGGDYCRCTAQFL